MLLEALETFMKGRDGREYRTTDHYGKAVRVFNDGPTLCVELNGKAQPFLALSDNCQEEVAGLTGAGLVVADVHDVTGIALGDSRVDTPGFPGAGLVGQATPEDKGTPGLSKYLDPARNPMIKLRSPDSYGPFDPALEPKIKLRWPDGYGPDVKKEDGELDKYLDPAQNPMIKVPPKITLRTPYPSVPPDPNFKPPKITLRTPYPMAKEEEGEIEEHLDPAKNKMIKLR